MPLTETEILDRHAQALGEGHRSCQHLARNADPTYLAPRGHDYGNLKRSLSALEGTCRQMMHFRADARWLKLSIIYVKAARMAQSLFIAQKWGKFADLQQLFEIGHRHLDELRDGKTGKLGPILPNRPSDWLVLPDHRVPTQPRPRRIIN